jgi:hypothetical protein
MGRTTHPLARGCASRPMPGWPAAA